jgi:hypothetical protein
LLDIKCGIALGSHGSDTNSDAMASSCQRRRQASCQLRRQSSDSSFKMAVEEIIAVTAYVRLRKQKLKKKQRNVLQNIL